jgi:hypothetical protein
VVDSIPPQNRNEFEAQADRAREKAGQLAAEGLADQAAADRRSEVGANDRPGPLTALLDRIRSAFGGVRGD